MNKKKSFIRWATAGLIFILGWIVLALTLYLLFAVVWAEKVWIALGLGSVTTGFGVFFIFRGGVKLTECALRPKLNRLPDEELDSIVRNTAANALEKVHVAKEILAGRRAAIAGIRDQGQLLRIVENDTDAFRRRTALEELSDPTTLTEVAKNHADPAIRAAAMDRVNDQNLFAEIARDDPDAQLQAKALAMLRDPLLLAGIVTSGARLEIQLEALNALASASGLEKIVKTHSDRRLRKAARQRLFSKFSWIEPLCVICGKDVSGSPVMIHKPGGIVCCESCGGKIGGPSGLVQAARQADECACGFKLIPGSSAFAACPSCSSEIDPERRGAGASQAEPGESRTAVPNDYPGCVRLLKNLAAAADARNAPTFAECLEYEAIRSIGERLLELGGLRLMQQAYTEVRGSGTYFSQDWWDKIGQWRA